MGTTKDDNNITFAELYPELTPAQQTEAEYYLTRYVEILWGIFMRLQQQNLTESTPDFSMRMK